MNLFRTKGGVRLVRKMLEIQIRISKQTVDSITAANCDDDHIKRQVYRRPRAAVDNIPVETKERIKSFAKNVYKRGYATSLGSADAAGGGALPLDLQSAWNIATTLYTRYLENEEPIRLLKVQYYKFSHFSINNTAAP